LPNFEQDRDIGLIFTDVAGMQDTAGEFVEVINSMVIKRIFMQAKSLRFLIPISQKSITDARGNQMRMHGNLIKRTFRDNLDTFIESIQPMITKCQPEK
jgi:hypothetical protein